MGRRLSIELAARTDTGLVRQNNEDALLAADLKTGLDLGSNYTGESEAFLLAVSDGMGGQRSGEVASQITLQSLLDRMLRTFGKAAPYDRLVQAVEDANYKVYKESGRKHEYSGMGATLTAALIEDGNCYIAEVGDSRAYLLRRGRIKQLTTDQSLISLFISRGLLTKEEAERSSHRGMLLQAIGVKEEIEVAVTSFPLQRGDCLVLCSDGLSNKLDEAEILGALSAQTLSQACEQMVELAKERGGEDNISLLLARLSGDGLGTGEAKITTTLKVLSSFDPDRPKARRRTAPLKSEVQSRNLIFPSTVGSSVPSRDLSNYEHALELRAEFERLTYHLEKATESLGKELEGLRRAADWLQQGGAIDKRLPDIFARLRSAQATLEQTSKSVAEAKREFKKI